MKSSFRKVLILVLFASWMVASCQTSDAFGQSPAERCAAANADLTTQIALAKQLPKRPPPIDPVDFSDECWDDPQNTSAREAIAAAWLKKLEDPEMSLVTSITNDANVLDTSGCGSSSKDAREFAHTLLDRIVDKLNDFISKCSKKNGYYKGAFLASKGIPDLTRAQLFGSENGGVLTALGNLYSLWVGDIGERVRKDHNFALLRTFYTNLKSAELMGAYGGKYIHGDLSYHTEDEDAINQFMDNTTCHVEIEYNFHVQNSSDKFLYQLKGKTDIKYDPQIDKWVPVDFHWGNGPPNPAKITLTYEKGESETKKGVANLTHITSQSIDANGNPTTSQGMSYETPIDLLITPCPSATNQMAFKIQDLGAADETWVAQEGDRKREFPLPMALQGMSNVFMANYTNPGGTQFVFVPKNFQNKQAQLMDETFKSDMMPQTSDMCEFHLTITHTPK